LRTPSHQSPATRHPPRTKSPVREGWHGWDEYAPFYDWENAQTLGRRDVPFWRRVAMRAGGPVLELGCGTGRVTRPLVEAGVDLVGIDRSAPMLERARDRPARRGATGADPAAPSTRASLNHPPRHPCRLTLVRGDIRALPFGSRTFSMVLAPYGILQSLIRPRDLAATLASVARVMKRGATLGIDVVPDVPQWREYTNREQLSGPGNGAHLTLIESVRQDRARRLTTFSQCYLERRGRRTREHRFDLTFRTLTVPQMTRQLERAGFAVTTVLGDYQGRPWDDRADVWIILANRL
jgi:ubiquinone/menaquinone biosynthesis C-methylase UbiE